MAFDDHGVFNRRGRPDRVSMDTCGVRQRRFVGLFALGHDGMIGAQ
jgi:hypothetical protein